LLATARRLPEKKGYLATWRFAWFVFLGLTFQPTLSNLMHGQVTGLIFLFFCLSWWLLHRQRQFCAGLALGMIVPFKFYPALFVLYFLWRRQWRVVAGAVVASALIAVVSLLTVGWQANLKYFGIVVSELRQGGMAAYNNQSILGFLLHAFTNHDISTWQDMADPSWLMVVRAGLTLSLVAVAVWTMRRPPKATAQPALAQDLDLALVVFIMLLASPITWYHYYMWLLMPLFVLFDAFLLSPEGQTRRMPSRSRVIGLAVAYGLIVVEGIVVLRPLAAQALNDIWLLRVLLSQSFFGAVLLMLLALGLRRRLSVRM